MGRNIHILGDYSPVGTSPGPVRGFSTRNPARARSGRRSDCKVSNAPTPGPQSGVRESGGDYPKLGERMRITVTPSTFGGQAMTRRVCDRAACRRPFIVAFTRRGEPGEFCSDFCLRNKDNDMTDTSTTTTNPTTDPIVSGNPQPDNTAKKAKKGNPVKKHKAAAKPVATQSAKSDKKQAKAVKTTAKADKAAKAAIKTAKTAKPKSKASSNGASNGTYTDAKGRTAHCRRYEASDVIRFLTGYKAYKPPKSQSDNWKLVKDGATVGDFLIARREKGTGSGTGILKHGQENDAISIGK